MSDKGFIHTEHTVICKCGYREKLEYAFGDTSVAAKKQGWKWDPTDGWKCSICSTGDKILDSIMKVGELT